MQGIKGAIVVATILSTAAIISACSKDVPHSKMGLGAGDVTATKVVK